MATSGTPTPTHFEPIFFGFLEVWPQELFITMATNFTNSLKVAKIDEKTAISLHSIVVLWIQFFFCQWFGCIRKAQKTQHAFRKRISLHIWRKKKIIFWNCCGHFFLQNCCKILSRYIEKHRLFRSKIWNNMKKISFRSSKLCTCWGSVGGHRALE